MFNIIQNKTMDELFCISKTTIQINCADDRLHRVRDNRRPLPSAGQILAFSEKQIVAKRYHIRTVSQRRLADKAGTEFRHLALRHRLVCVEQEVAGNHLEHGITKEFQTFIAACLIPMLFVCVGTVSQGVSQKSWILELVTDHFLKFFKFFFHD